jgi:Ca2+-binding RTX toxin-like protein
LIYFGSTGFTGTGNSLNNFIQGRDQADILSGLDGDDSLFGLGGDDLLLGGAGSDLLVGGLGADRMEGGSGDDTYFVDDAGDVVVEQAGEGRDRVQTTLANYTLGANVEDLTFIGSGASSLRGNSLSNKITGSASADLISLIDGGDDIAEGGEGNDNFLLGASMTAADQIVGGAGRDVVAIQGSYSGLVLGSTSLIGVEIIGFLPGSDTRFGAPGSEFYSYALTTHDANVAAGEQLTLQFNTLRAGENVTFNGSAETDGIFFTFAGQGVDILVGGQQSDRFFFGADRRFGASDKVDGQGGSDDQFALQGDYSGANAVVFAADTLLQIEKIGFLSAGDSRFGSGSADGFDYDITMHDGNVAAGQRLIVQANNLKSSGTLDETLIFNGSAETDGSFNIFAGEGNDTILGGAGADSISGRGGDDRIVGGGGADTLRGDAGNDVFAYLAVSDSGTGSADSIIGFTTGDRIDLSAIDAQAGGGDDAFTYIGSQTFTAAGQVRVTQTGSGSWLVEADVNGDALADLSINFISADPAYIPSPNDFVL